MKQVLIALQLLLLFGFMSCERTPATEGKQSLIDIIPEPAGPNCTSGGLKLVSGIDQNRNGVLEDNEIQVTEYICNGDDGIDGINSLISVSAEPTGNNCSYGGYKIMSGNDINFNDTLDSIEILNTAYICNGIDGLNSLISVSAEPAGNNCSNGGYKIMSGNDQNSNNILDPIEILNTEYICNGNDGINSLISVLAEPAGDYCSNGGYKIISGNDLNSNNTLDPIEILITEYICNGIDGINSLISVLAEPAGNNCLNGGYKVMSGNDLNSNNILDSIEILNTEFICNGIDGLWDKQIRFDFGSSGYTGLTNDHVTWQNCEEWRIPFFNINNYPDLDSVLFFATLEVYSGSGECIVELYNFTDNQIIQNGELRSSANVETYVESKVNLLTYMPDKEIILGIRLRSTIEGSMVIVSNPQLILYRQ
jgi:hypothetical protein